MEELLAERERVAFLYRKLDGQRAVALRALEEALGDTTAQRWQREVDVRTLSDQLSRLRVADDGLCFGRTDHVDGARTYIGRIGLFDEADEYEPLLTDWRAPAARPFYVATAAVPEGLTRRRHFHTRGRRLQDFHDDELRLDGVALTAALDAPREEVMRDIVATIQVEQDEIIRLDHPGVLVVEGGPGTGKTAVALHRVAYLLYTQRERLAKRGVLIVGPNSGFLRYIGNVLPSLGETDVVFASPGDLMPRLRTVREDVPAVQRRKGSLDILDVLVAAVAQRQEVPDVPIPIELEHCVVHLDAAIADAARTRARQAGLLHNHTRAVFHEALVDLVLDVALAEIDEPWDGVAVDVRREVYANRELRAAVDVLWPALTPRRFLAEFYESADRCAELGVPEFHREVGRAWTVSDVPLLDEAAELLGEHALKPKEEKAGEEYAQGVLEILDTDPTMDPDLLRAVDLIDAEHLAERHVERDHRYLAERAAADREWTYGHVVVDEAQELSEMDWRLLFRRCPSKSMTIVGDLSQRQSAAGARTWAAMLDRYAGDRWAYRELTLNYRTPAEIMDVAAVVLAEVNPAASLPKSVRHNGIPPWATLVTDLAAAVAAELAVTREGTIAVIAPDGIDLPGPVITPREAKGLEFDTVLVVEPHLMTPGELYVALTRATQRLGVLHTTPLPPSLQTLT
ncbi:helicase [Umezawaea sp. Da 62-37]|uniref:helicase n=1 Tax=Umezawaea sp. Da 62-37 TaxID=3075927 RepID=UPI0028F6FC1A|nr:helicase [Umezawaea sp. Da 62-37]WNV84377.1 helicase [Umezawaea sp. Da 62-37]